MIVKCGNCQTRFKIPDEKVTDKGVKVRCTKCQNTFRVTKADAQPATVPAAAPPPEADPFAKFGPSVDPIHEQQTRPFQLPPDLLAAQPKVTAAHAGPLTPSFAAQADVPREMFDQPTRIGPLPTRPQPKTAPPAFDPFDFGKPAAGAAPAAAPSADPFDFGAPAPAPGGAADPFDFDAQPTRVNNAANPAPVAAANAFDFGSAAPPAPPASPAPGAINFDFSSPGPDPFAADTTKPNAKQLDPLASAEPTNAGGNFAAGEPTQPNGSKPDPFASAEPTQTDPFGGFTQPGGGAHVDPFASQPSGAKAMLSDVPPADSMGDAADARAMFDMPEKKAEPPPEPPPKENFGPAVPLAQIKLNKIPASELANPSEPKAEQEEEKPKGGAAKKVTGVFVNVAIAAALFCILGAVGLVYLNEGKLEAQSFQPARLKSMLMGSASWTAGDLSNGLYDTKGGKPVFFVRGEVKNRGSKPGKVKVRAEIMDGSALVRSAEVYAGQAPTPEELYGIGSANDVDALSSKLEKGAQTVSPGGTAPFLIAFYEYPPDLSGFRLKVTVLEAGAEQTAAR